jgi:hypothetical protein
MIYVFYVEVPEFGSMVYWQPAHSEQQARRTIIHDLNAFGNTAKRIVLKAVQESAPGLYISNEEESTIEEIEDD